MWLIQMQMMYALFDFKCFPLINVKSALNYRAKNN